MITMEITKTCSLDGCDRPHKGHGYCRVHLDRVKRTGDPGPAEIRVYALPSCTIDGCTDEHVALGLCDRHYARLRKHGDPLHFEPRVGERAPNWKGDEITYTAAHHRVRAIHGSASNHSCTCGQPAIEWAYDHKDPNALTAVANGCEVRYSTDPTHYIAMCRPCHRKLDYHREKVTSGSP